MVAYVCGRYCPALLVEGFDAKTNPDSDPSREHSRPPYLPRSSVRPSSLIRPSRDMCSRKSRRSSSCTTRRPRPITKSPTTLVGSQIKSRWLGIATQVVNSNTRSVFGETGGWNPAVTAGINIPGVWSTATYGIHPPPFYAEFPAGREFHVCEHCLRQCSRWHEPGRDARHRQQPQQSTGE